MSVSIRPSGTTRPGSHHQLSAHATPEPAGHRPGRLNERLDRVRVHEPAGYPPRSRDREHPRDPMIRPAGREQDTDQRQNACDAR